MIPSLLLLAYLKIRSKQRFSDLTCLCSTTALVDLLLATAGNVYFLGNWFKAGNSYTAIVPVQCLCFQIRLSFYLQKFTMSGLLLLEYIFHHTGAESPVSINDSSIIRDYSLFVCNCSACHSPTFRLTIFFLSNYTSFCAPPLPFPKNLTKHKQQCPGHSLLVVLS